MEEKGNKLGKYTLAEQLGSGSFGWVYKAKDPIGRTVAVKVLKPGWADDPVTIERFRREAQVAGELFHTRIATIIDFDEFEGRRFLVMRYIDGVSLDVLLKEKGCLPWEKALEILGQAAEGLDYAHRRGYVHRDIKPANILVGKEDGAVLTDFGLVRAAEASGGSSSGAFLGTPAYIAPEIWSGKKAGPATDLYSLACVAYEMLTGALLFGGENTPEILTKHVLNMPELPENWPDDVPQGLNEVLARALDKDPSKRQASAGAFVAELKGLEAAARQKEAQVEAEAFEKTRQADAAEAARLAVEEERERTRQAQEARRMAEVEAAKISRQAEADRRLLEQEREKARQLQVASQRAEANAAEKTRQLAIQAQLDANEKARMKDSEGEPMRSATLPRRMLGGTSCLGGLFVTIGVFICLLVFVIWLVGRLSNSSSLPSAPAASQVVALEPATPAIADELPTVVSSESTKALAATRSTPEMTPTMVGGLASELGVGSTSLGKDGMTLLYVPAGDFTMGSEKNDDEKPVHIVTLDAFWIDQTEVTNAMYTQCVNAGKCTPPQQNDSNASFHYYDDANYADYPVVYVSWTAAKTYCTWAERRLPTEAEWEKAARGTDQRNFPWGEGINHGFANYQGVKPEKVAGFESGKSPYGAYDMAGNVWEWVADSYGPYTVSQSKNPTKPVEGTFKVLRGGNYASEIEFIRSAHRYMNDISFVNNDIGIRCANDAPVDVSSTAEAFPTSTSESTIADTSGLGIGSTKARRDGMTMLYVPAGPFLMGNDAGNSNEIPEHTVTLDAYWIDQTEVTNAMYAQCVQSKTCSAPIYNNSNTRSSYYGNPDYADFPVINIDWDRANAYCTWVGASLPSEAEWEKAARGTDGRYYPWGNSYGDSGQGNFSSHGGDTERVGSYEAGRSPYGIYDMAGNAWEWVADWYGLYDTSITHNPTGPETGKARILRGGSWNSFNGYVRGYSNVGSTFRFEYLAAIKIVGVGFRCASSAP